MLRRGSELIRTKLALLQSKRLYPIEQSIDEAEIDHYLIGFGRLYEDDAVAADASAPRLFSFTEASEYKMILVGDQQVGHIDEFERSNKTPVHYLLYNPSIVPWTQSHPLPATGRPPSASVVGCRVVPACALRLLLGQSVAGSSPSYGELSRPAISVSGIADERRPTRGGLHRAADHMQRGPPAETTSPCDTCSEAAELPLPRRSAHIVRTGLCRMTPCT